jgi:integrase/recombinase XerD
VLHFLRYLDSTEKSPNTLRAYAFDLRLYWEFLGERGLDWREVSLDDLAAFIVWLRAPNAGVIPFGERNPARTEKTTNRILGTLTSFYEFHERETGPELALRTQSGRILGRSLGCLGSPRH